MTTTGAFTAGWTGGWEEDTTLLGSNEFKSLSSESRSKSVSVAGVGAYVTGKENKRSRQANRKGGNLLCRIS